MSRPQWFFVAVLTAPLVSACGEESSVSLNDDLCGVTLLSTADWVRHDEGLFTLLVPASYGEPQREGFDSYTAVWGSGGESLSYDWGSYSNDLTTASDLGVLELESCDPTPLGAARLVVGGFPPTGPRGVVAAHWTRLEDSEIPFLRERLTVTGWSRTQTDTAELLTILSTVQVRPVDLRREWPGEMGVVVCGTAEAPTECRFESSGGDSGAAR